MGLAPREKRFIEGRNVERQALVTAGYVVVAEGYNVPRPGRFLTHGTKLTKVATGKTTNFGKKRKAKARSAFQVIS